MLWEEPSSMGRRDFQSTVADALPRIIQDQAKNSIGSIKFTRKDKKTIGKVYLRAGAIYAIETNNYSPNIVSRIVTNEFISESNRDQIIAKFAKDLTNTAVVDFALKYQLFPEKPLTTYIKDYFFDAFDELVSWTEVNAEWRSNEEAPNNVLRVSNANPKEVLEVLVKRKKHLENVISPQWSTHPRDIDSLTYTINEEYKDSEGNLVYEEPDYTKLSLITIALEQNLTIGYAASYLGLSRFNTRVAIYNLWEAGVVDIIHPTTLRYSNRTEEDIKRATTVRTSASNVTPDPAPVISTTEPQVEETVSYGNEEDYASTQTSPVEELQIIEQPSVNYDETEENIPNREYQVNDYSLPEELNASADPIEGTQYPELSSVQTTIKEHQMTESTHTSGSSRLREMVQQIKQELAALEVAIENAKKVVEGRQAYVKTLHDERTMFVNKLQDLDNKIKQENSSIESAKTELEKLTQEYQESKSLLS